MTEEQMLAKLEEIKTTLTKRATDAEAAASTAAEALKAAEARAQRAEAVAKLNPAHRTHFDKFDTAKQDEFLKADEEQRATIVKACETDEEEEMAKSPLGKRFIEMQKQLQERDERLAKAEQRVAKAEEERELAEYTKRAEQEIPNIPGESLMKGAVLRRMYAKLEKADADTLLGFLKAGDEALSKLTEEVGKSGEGVAAGSAVAKLDALAKAYADKHSVSFAKAYNIVIKDHPKLYEEAASVRS